MLDGPQRLRGFVCDLTRFSDAHAGEAAMLEAGAASLRELVAQDDWLPDEFAVPDPAMYRQYLLYCDPLERFSVVSFVWGPGQRTPVHDHTVSGLIGMLRGSERSSQLRFRRHRPPARGAIDRLSPGAVTAVSPRIGDIHRVENALLAAVDQHPRLWLQYRRSHTAHLRCRNSNEKPFVSGYSNKMLPNIWDRSAEIRGQIGLVA